MNEDERVRAMLAYGSAFERLNGADVARELLNGSKSSGSRGQKLCITVEAEGEWLIASNGQTERTDIFPFRNFALIPIGGLIRVTVLPDGSIAFRTYGSGEEVTA